MQLKEEELRSNFIKDCINGDALLQDIDDYIDKWHDSEIDEPLFSYLGMSKKEYALFVEDENYLASIVTAHKEDVDIETIMKVHLSIAARSDSHSKSQRLESWLKNEQLWE